MFKRLGKSQFSAIHWAFGQTDCGPLGRQANCIPATWASGLEHPSALHFAVRTSIQLGVRIGTKIGKQGLVLGLEPLALHGCGWLTLKAKSLDQRREAALVTIAVSAGMGKLMHQDTQDPDWIVNDRADQNLVGLISRGPGRPMLTHGTVLSRPGVTGWETTGNPNVVRERMIKSRVHGTQFGNRLSQPVFSSSECIHMSEPPK
jgi:hypothetical protein